MGLSSVIMLPSASLHKDNKPPEKDMVSVLGCVYIYDDMITRK